jgi:hypothetical protein
MNDGRPDNLPRIDSPRNVPISAIWPIQGDNEPFAPSLAEFEEGIRASAEAHAWSAIEEMRRVANGDD